LGPWTERVTSVSGWVSKAMEGRKVCREAWSHESDKLIHLAGLPPIPRAEFVQQHKWLVQLPRRWIAYAADRLEQTQGLHLIEPFSRGCSAWANLNPAVAPIPFMGGAADRCIAATAHHVDQSLGDKIVL
jgi:hypothetical protein